VTMDRARARAEENLSAGCGGGFELRTCVLLENMDRNLLREFVAEEFSWQGERRNRMSDRGM